MLCGNLGAPPNPPCWLSKRPASSPNARFRIDAVGSRGERVISDRRAICAATSPAMRVTSSLRERYASDAATSTSANPGRP